MASGGDGASIRAELRRLRREIFELSDLMRPLIRDLTLVDHHSAAVRCAGMQVDSLAYHIRHNELSGKPASRARLATWRAKGAGVISGREAADASKAHAQAVTGRHILTAVSNSIRGDNSVVSPLVDQNVSMDVDQGVVESTAGVDNISHMTGTDDGNGHGGMSLVFDSSQAQSDVADESVAGDVGAASHPTLDVHADIQEDAVVVRAVAAPRFNGAHVDVPDVVPMRFRMHSDDVDSLCEEATPFAAPLAVSHAVPAAPQTHDDAIALRQIASRKRTLDLHNRDSIVCVPKRASSK